MKAVIMAGGFGTRLRPLTINVPKPLVPVANIPIMEKIVKLLAKHGFKDILAILYYQPEQIKDYFQNGEKWGVNIEYFETQSDYGTAGAVKNAIKGFDEPVLVISADILTNFNLKEIIKFHENKKAKVTVTLTRVKDPLEYGIVITKKSGRIERFLEKPMWGEVFSDTVNTGIYVIEPEVQKYIPESVEYDFSKNLFPMLMQKGVSLYGHIAEGYWRDIGNISEYYQANMDVLEKRIKMPIDGQKVEMQNGVVYLGENSTVSDKSVIKNTVVVGNNSEIGDFAHLDNVVIGDGVKIEDNVSISNSILWNGVKIGRGVRMIENVLGKDVKIKKKSILNNGVVIGDKSVIGSSCNIKHHVKIWPSKVIEDETKVSYNVVWSDRVSRSIFSKYGVTGTGNIEITPEFAAKLGMAYGAFLDKGTSVITSRDSHRASRMIHRALISGITSQGVNVIDLELCPIPVTRYELKSYNAHGGFHVRKSPYELPILDIKFFDSNGLDLMPAKEKTIEKYFYSEDFPRISTEEVGVITFPYARVIERYIHGFLQTINQEAISKRNFKIVIDYAYGSASRILPSILGGLNCEVVSLNSNIDEKKITKTAVEFDYSLRQLSNIVVTLGAQAGFLLDTGGEKIFLVDEKGAIYTTENLLDVVSLLFCKNYNGSKIAVPTSASRVIEEIASKYDVSVKRTKVSPASIMEVVADNEFNFAGEKQGGFIFSEFQPAYDGMMSLVKILEMLALSNLSLSDLKDEIPQTFQINKSISCSWDDKGKVMRYLVERNRRRKKAEYIDGLKLYKGNNWVLILPDPDKPQFRVYAEADRMEKAEKMIDESIEEIKKAKVL